MERRLDDSHLCLLKRWITYEQMRRCAADFDGHLKEAVEETIRLLKRKYGGGIRSDTNRLSQEGWFDVFPPELGRLISADGAIICFGIEGVGVGEILGAASGKSCRAYAYCRWSGPDKMRLFTKFSALLTSLRFNETFTDSKRPQFYYLAMSLPALRPEQFLRPKELVNAFHVPLSRLLDWYHLNSSKIGKFKPS